MTSQISADVVTAGTGQRRTRITGNGVLWVVQALWGVFFAGSGFGKVLLYDDTLYAAAPQAVAWYAAVSQPLIVFIGVAEVLGGLGLILPAMTRVRPSLTPLAAAGLTLTMILAGAFHVVRGEFELLPYNIVLGAVAAVIAVGRWTKRPIPPAPLTRGRLVLSVVVVALVVLLVFGPTWYSMTRF
ncbi:putative membrane protein YphA (DoxX/SURF4 family) [Hamadaea flava]|uniref:DoxX family protein n=1 Tax=Hamadaea flava TaxID=1742688 RepID=A0ABV8LPC5_9ACTN|nr:DoxX family protein [Hamadaea flava]MCP2323231.1 putative membrane protein YphA (DoxX/SURF4 family) [Hamadaea flava]